MNQLNPVKGRTIAFVGATLLPVTSPAIRNGRLLVKDGIITAIGPDIPLDKVDEIIECSGMTIAPGLIDCHAHVGIVPEGQDWEYSDVNEDISPVTPYVRARDGIDFNDIGFEEALEGGVTSMIIHPGSSNVIGGLDLAVKAAGPSIEKRILRDPAGMKMAWSRGGQSRKSGDSYPYPNTRMGVAAILREWLIKAQDYKNQKNQGLDAGAQGNGASSLSARERMGLENMIRVLNREIPARIHSMTPVDFRAMLRIKEEFGIEMTIEHGDEAYLMVEELAEAGIPVIYGPFVGDRRVSFWRHARPDAVLILARAGVTVAFQTDHPVIPIRDLRIQGSLVMRFGGGEPDEILRMLTINGAKIMGLDHRIGSLEVGKDADFAIYTGHPLAVQSRVEAVYIDGQQVYGDKLRRIQ